MEKQTCDKLPSTGYRNTTPPRFDLVLRSNSSLHKTSRNKRKAKKMQINANARRSLVYRVKEIFLS